MRIVFDGFVDVAVLLSDGLGVLHCFLIIESNEIKNISVKYLFMSVLKIRGPVAQSRLLIAVSQ